MARLTYVYRAEDISYVNIGRRQLPVIAGDNLMMLMDLNSKGLSIDSPQIRGKELEEFTRKFNLLSSEELRQSLEIDSNEFVAVLNQCVQCVGCRRSVERLFYQLTLSGHPTLDPLILKTSCVLSIAEEKLKTPQTLGTILYRHHEILNNLLENKLRNKTRCVLHSLDTFRTKPFSETWREIWSSMKHNCRDELAVIETKELHEVLDNYLKKHKFCQGCRTKIEKAYNILVGDTTSKEKGFVAALYANIKKCHPDKHIHVVTNKIDFLDALIRRAEPEVNGSFSKQRERHAKTLEIAQEEVLTCVGMIMYERLRRVYVSLREEERACQMLAAVGVHALCRSFDMSVEKKQGISNLELLYQEISRAEKAKEHKREQKKLKKKKRKSEKKKSCHPCEAGTCTAGSDTAEADEEPDENMDAPLEEVAVSSTAKDNAMPSTLRKYNEEREEAEVVNDPSCIGTKSLPFHLEKPGKQQQQAKQKQKSQKNKKKKKQNTPASKRMDCNASFFVAEHSPNTVDEPNGKCIDCQAPSSNCPCEIDICTKSLDAGYSTDHNSHLNSRTSSVVSSPEGSEVSCSEGFCNHGQSNEAHETEHDVDHQHIDDDQHADGDCRHVDENLRYVGQYHHVDCGHEHVNESRQSVDHGHHVDVDHHHADGNHPRDHSDCDVCAPECCQQSRQSLSLLQMLDDFDDCDEDEENCYIPQEVVLEYQYQHEKVQQQRQQLRETLKQNFARLCMQRGLSVYNCK